MDSKCPTFQSTSHLKKSQVHYNHYNIFHILERKRLLWAKRKDVADLAAISQLEAEKTSEPDKSTLAYKMYHSLTLPPLPSRYHKLNLPSHWFIDLVQNQKKRRLHRKSHGLIPFRELAQLVANNHKAADFDTLVWCRDVASKLAKHNKAMENDFMKNHKTNVKADTNTSSTASPNQAESLEAESPHLRLSAQVSAILQPLLEGRRQSDVELNQQQTLQASKMELNQESMKRFLQRRLAYIMNAEGCDASLSSTLDRVMLSAFDEFGTIRDRILSHQHNFYPLSFPVSKQPLAALIAAHDQGQGGVMTSLPVTRASFTMAATASSTAEFYESDEATEECSPKKRPSRQEVELDLTNDELKQPFNLVAFLREMLEDPDAIDIIHWLPCGTIFTITDKKSFVEQLLPLLQDKITGTTHEEKFNCFKTRLNQWNFKELPSSAQNPNGAYKKEGFVRHERVKALKDAVSVVGTSKKLPASDIYRNAATCVAYASHYATSYISTSYFGQVETVAARNSYSLTNILTPAQVVGYPSYLYPHYPHQAPLAYTYRPLTMQPQAGFKPRPKGIQEAQHSRNELMLHSYQGLQAASFMGQSAVVKHSCLVNQIPNSLPTAPVKANWNNSSECGCLSVKQYHCPL